MKVTDIYGVVKGLDPRDTQKGGMPAARPPGEENRTDHGDTLDLSISARISVASADPDSLAAADSEALTPDRAAEIQSRIRSGHYDQAATLDSIARRLLNFYARS